MQHPRNDMCACLWVRTFGHLGSFVSLGVGFNPNRFDFHLPLLRREREIESLFKPLFPPTSWSIGLLPLASHFYWLASLATLSM